LTRHFCRFASLALLAALSSPWFLASAQQQVPAAPAQTTAAPPQNATAPAQNPSAPPPAAAPVFPKPDPKNFTAASPSKEVIDGFLQTSWGYDPDRVWQVQGILKTAVDGVSKVIIYIGDKSGKQKPTAFLFFVLPDGKHIIAGDDVYPFGDHPYAANRATLQQNANGPYRGSASKDLELVEFADFQCPHCKTAQASMDKLATDFPKAHIVFQNYPLENIHPQSKKAAGYAVCVAKLGGSTAFFQYADAVFEGQDGLATADGATLTLNSAVTKAGQDPAKVAACAATPATEQEVASSVTMAQDLNINETPMLMVNGRQVPIGGIPYETLKNIVAYQAKSDGLAQ
jgi:protein-disulfide isomerase